jgi:hypothetical protein
MQAADLLTIAGVVLGAVFAVAGLVQLNPRMRARFGLGRGTGSKGVGLALGLIVAGAFLIMLSIGVFTD